MEILSGGWGECRRDRGHMPAPPRVLASHEPLFVGTSCAQLGPGAPSARALRVLRHAACLCCRPRGQGPQRTDGAGCPADCQDAALKTSRRGGARGKTAPVRGSGVRSSGRCPHWGQRVMSMPVHCSIHCVTVFFLGAGGGSGWPNTCRQWRSACALHRLARKP